jgi:hypothetical protein
MFLFNPYDRNNLINKKYFKKGEKPFKQYLDKADVVPLPRDEDDYDEYLDSIEKTRLVILVPTKFVFFYLH